MSKEESEQRWARKSLKEMISAVEKCVGKLNGSMEDLKEALDGVEGRIDNWKEQSRDYAKLSLNSTMDKVNELFNSHKDKLSDRNNALEAMMLALKEETMATVMALSTRIEELERELALVCGDKACTRCGQFLEEDGQCPKGIVDDMIKVNTASMFLTDIELLWWQGRTTNKRQCEIGMWQEFQCKLKG
ncbi:hypothetical protein Goari_027202 [Gossypium aridum]|uniref:Uncharacterized protein n=1 Tax=Gossypium aridum TaxID=34290 RepID=A0A7J8YLN5_GOSAI|nr:hypothetical protein [Gossypium aridum]